MTGNQLRSPRPHETLVRFQADEGQRKTLAVPTRPICRGALHGDAAIA
jgi:hypothetical protein